MMPISNGRPKKEAMVLMAEEMLEYQEMEKGKAVRQKSGVWLYKAASWCSWCI